MKRLPHSLTRIALLIIVVGALASGIRNIAIVSATSTETLGTEATAAPTSTPDSSLLPSGDWTLYPLVTLAMGVAGQEYDEGNPNYTSAPISVRFTIATGSVTIDNLIKTPLPFQQIAQGVFGALYNDTAPDERVDSTTGESAMLLDFNNPQELWLIEGQVEFESSAQILMLALPGKPVTPDPRYSGAKACPGALDPLLKIGDRAMFVGDMEALGATPDDNNVRADTKPSAMVVGTLRPMVEMDVLDGPICASNQAYWKINANGIIGWIADSKPGEQAYRLLPKRFLEHFDMLQMIGNLPVTDLYGPSAVATSAAGVAQCPGSPPTRLTIGGDGRVLPGLPNFINTAPLRPTLHPGESRSITRIPGGGTFSVLDGPQCADGITWWKVKYKNYTGWTGESDTDYWVEPLN